MELPKSINLMISRTEEEVKVIKTKESIDVSSVLGIFVFVFIGLVILVVNLYYKSELKKVQDQKDSFLIEIRKKESQSLVETKQRQIFERWNAYSQVKDLTVTDFQKKLLFMVDMIPSECDVPSFSFENDNTFSFSGECISDSYVKSLSQSLLDNDNIKSCSIVNLSLLDEDSDEGEEQIDFEAEYGFIPYRFSIKGEFTENSF
ncbi:MAG TPA: hypothetical protein PK957_02470 [Candidatus Dojkabacteria bacterium]|nr:hypothetical protein [Candidatus Dojkabacteria bacterium]HQF36379.1 hypothetical protein [Candidatus Dojkabacteria bacterium]